jgi:hypothetical protein
VSPGNSGPADKQGSEEKITGSQSAQWRIQDKAMADKRHVGNITPTPLAEAFLAPTRWCRPHRTLKFTDKVGSIGITTAAAYFGDAHQSQSGLR